MGEHATAEIARAKEFRVLFCLFFSEALQAFYDIYQINRIYKVYSRLVFDLFVIVALFLNSFNAGANVPVNCTHNQILYPTIHSKCWLKKWKYI